METAELPPMQIILCEVLHTGRALQRCPIFDHLEIKRAEEQTDHVTRQA